jgi:hypothetical protein
MLEKDLLHWSLDDGNPSGDGDLTANVIKLFLRQRRGLTMALRRSVWRHEA